MRRARQGVPALGLLCLYRAGDTRRAPQTAGRMVCHAVACS